MARLIAVLGCLLAFLVCSYAQATGQTLTSSVVPQLAQRAQYNTSNYIYSFETGTAIASNAGGEIRPMDAARNGLLATITQPGVSFNRGTLNACSVLMPHVHPRATEIYYVISGNISVGLVQENGGTPITGYATTNSAFVVPQGLIHFMYNPTCSPAPFTQSFSSTDPGLLSLPNVLQGVPGTVLSVSGLSATASGLAPFALDSACQAACGGLAPSGSASAGRK